MPYALRVAIARFRKLCLDSRDPSLVGPFWAAVLARRWEPRDDGEGGIVGSTPRHTIWINKVPEPKSVKHRVHFDIYARDLGDLEALGSRVVRPAGDDRRWTVMADPEGGEYCAFLRDDLPADLMHGLVVDSVDPYRQAHWWAELFDATVVDHESGYSTVENVEGMPILTMDFVPVPEPKAVKNRIHPDLTASDPEAVLAAGATLLREPDADVSWYVMADPEGNEFCVFAER
jgi:predicted enzyme related to lactoylglutathione lyase